MPKKENDIEEGFVLIGVKKPPKIPLERKDIPVKKPPTVPPKKK